MGRGLESTVTARYLVEFLAELKHPHEELPGRGSVLRLRFAHCEVGSKCLAIVGKRYYELGRNGTLSHTRVALRREIPAEGRFRENAEARQVRDRPRLGVELALLNAASQ